MSPVDLIKELVVMIEYEEHLKKTQEDWETRLENVQELLNFAREAVGAREETEETKSGHCLLVCYVSQTDVIEEMDNKKLHFGCFFKRRCCPPMRIKSKTQATQTYVGPMVK